LAEQARWTVLMSVPTSQYTQAGVLGIALFATALVAVELANRARKSAALARERAAELADLGKLNERIVERLQSGILVLLSDQVLLANDAANELLGTRLTRGSRVRTAEPELAAQLDTIRRSRDAQGELNRQQRRLRVSVSRQPQQAGDQVSFVDTLFIDDASALLQQAQLLKMASLGTLTASIAHELRNPIAAMAHAAQLLADDPSDQDENQRLADIIRRHSARLNRIFADVLDLGRRRDIHTEVFGLAEWLRQFTDDYRTSLARRLRQQGAHPGPSRSCRRPRHRHREPGRRGRRRPLIPTFG
jgi:two-component system sensor histidine kinase PilS (NtrC family)